MDFENNPKFVGLGGAAAGASIATAGAGLVLPAVSLAFPLGGALIALGALLVTGVLSKPQKTVYDPEKHIELAE